MTTVPTKKLGCFSTVFLFTLGLFALVIVFSILGSALDSAGRALGVYPTLAPTPTTVPFGPQPAREIANATPRAEIVANAVGVDAPALTPTSPATAAPTITPIPTVAPTAIEAAEPTQTPDDSAARNAAAKAAGRDTPTPKPTPTLAAGEQEPFSYDDLARNTEDRVGRTIYVQGDVVQVMELWFGAIDLRVQIKDGIILVHYDDQHERLLVGDEIDLEAVVNGRYTYQNVLGAQMVIPEVTAVLIERVSD